MAPGLRMTPKNTQALSAKMRKLAKEAPYAVQTALYVAAEGMQEDLERTVFTWTHPVEFEIREFKGGYVVVTDDFVWSILNVGTRPHEITGNPFLSFQSGYAAKTRSAWLGSDPSGGAFGDYVTVQSVQHPGTQPRKWTEAALKVWQPKVPKLVREALRELT